jgi:hypothetical protein
MHNDPELDPKYLGRISSDFVKVADLIKEASYQLRKRKISEFPIFPVSLVGLPIGSILYEKGKIDGNQWNYYASFLEEFEQRQLVEKPEEFKQVYKNPDEFCCLFIVDESFTNFIFIPYPTD